MKSCSSSFDLITFQPLSSFTLITPFRKNNSFNRSLFSSLEVSSLLKVFHLSQILYPRALSHAITCRAVRFQIQFRLPLPVIVDHPQFFAQVWRQHSYLLVRAVFLHRNRHLEAVWMQLTELQPLLPGLERTEKATRLWRHL